MSIERFDWGTNPPVAPAAKPDFAREDLELLSGYEPGTVEHVAEPAAPSISGADSVMDEARAALRSGHLSPDEVARIYGLTAEEATALTQPKTRGPSLASTNAELAQIDKHRRADPRAYYRDEKLQARERQLIEARDKLKAGLAAADGDGEVAAEGEPDVSALDPALIEEWQKSGGVQHHLRVAQQTAKAALDGLETEDAVAFQQSFDALPDGARTQVFRHLAIGSPGFTKAASAADLKEFGQTEEGAALVEEWGNKAAQRFGVARGRINSILSGMSEADQRAALAWYDGLSSAQSKTVLKTLAK